MTTSLLLRLYLSAPHRKHLYSNVRLSKFTQDYKFCIKLIAFNKNSVDVKMSFLHCMKYNVE